ncbi:MAG: glycosyltransferase family 39 protein [Anaerolineae bacterium]|nr:glycosyltransferase family 39 protein [Anaerolineae bacterium]
MRSARWKELLAFLLILGLALGLRFYRLSAQSLWNDEGTSVALAQRDLATITQNAAHDIHPPFYYYLLHFWVRLWGTSEVAVRALSALLGTLLVAGLYGWLRSLWSPEEALLAAFLVAVAPFQVYYSQEARMYILMSLLGLCSTWALSALLRTEKKRAGLGLWAAYFFSSLLAIYSHYLSFFLLIAQGVALVLWVALRREALHPWRLLGAWVGVQVLLLLSYLPWLRLSWASLRSWPAVSEPLHLWHFGAQAVRTLSFGVASKGLPWVRWLTWGQALLVILGLCLPRERRVARPGWGLVMIAAYLLVPLGVLYLLSLSRPMFKSKFLLLVSPAFLALQARGVFSLAFLRGALAWQRWVAWGMALVLVIGLCLGDALALQRLYFDPSCFRDDYRGIVAYIEATAGPQDAILINAPSQIETVDYYYHGPLAQYPLPRQRPMDPQRTEAELKEIVARHPRIYAIFWATRESDPQGFVEGWLDRHCFKAMDSWFGNVRLVVYAVPRAPAQEIAHPLDVVLGDKIRLRGYTLLTPRPRSGEIVQLTLFWEALAPIAKRYKVFVHLVDARGNIVGQRDSEPGGGGRLTTTWKPGETLADNYGVLIRPGTPPGQHTLVVGMYGLEDGQRLPIVWAGKQVGDALQLTPLMVLPAKAPPPLAALDLRAKDDVSWGGLRLLGHNAHRLGFAHQPTAPLHPGDVLELVLFWRKEGPALCPYALEAVLQDREGRVLARWPIQVVGGSYPPSDWREGEVVRDIHKLPLPAELKPGSYRLFLQAMGQKELLERLTIHP